MRRVVRGSFIERNPAMIVESTSATSEKVHVHRRIAIDSGDGYGDLGSLQRLAFRAVETSSSFGFRLAHAARAGLRLPCDLAISVTERTRIGTLPRARKIVDRFDRRMHDGIARAEAAVRDVARALRERGHGDPGLASTPRKDPVDAAQASSKRSAA